MELINFMEDVVSGYVDEVIAADPSFCGCARCRLDVIAIALNEVKPKYVVTTKGYAYARMGELQAQFRADTIVAVTKALKIVRERPFHQVPGVAGRTAQPGAAAPVGPRKTPATAEGRLKRRRKKG